MKPTSDEWNRYYDEARRRRHSNGGDPLTLYREQEWVRERDSFIALTMVLVTIVAFFCFLFIP